MKVIFIFRLFIITFLLLLSRSSLAVDGCLLPNNIIYTTGTLIFHNFSDTYSRSGVTLGLSANYCYWTPTSGSRCYVCTTGLGCTDTPTEGIRANFTMVECPIDDYSLFIVLLSGCIGFFFIKVVPERYLHQHLEN